MIDFEGHFHDIRELIREAHEGKTLLLDLDGCILKRIVFLMEKMHERLEEIDPCEDEEPEEDKKLFMAYYTEKEAEAVEKFLKGFNNE